jgi:hypothetical protein
MNEQNFHLIVELDNDLHNALIALVSCYDKFGLSCSPFIRQVLIKHELICPNTLYLTEKGRNFLEQARIINAKESME